MSKEAIEDFSRRIMLQFREQATDFPVAHTINPAEDSRGKGLRVTLQRAFTGEEQARLPEPPQGMWVEYNVCPVDTERGWVKP